MNLGVRGEGWQAGGGGGGGLGGGMHTKLSCMVVSLLCLTLPSLIAAGKHKNAFFYQISKQQS